MEIQIKNQKQDAIKTGKWSNPGAKFYDELLKASNWKEVVQESYAVAPVKDISNTEDEKTSFAKSGCKYPHHALRNGKLVVSIPGLRSAYICARNEGCFSDDPEKRPTYSRTLVTHLNRHFRELRLKPTWHHGEFYLMEESAVKIEENFNDICQFLEEKTGICLHETDMDHDIIHDTSLIEESMKWIERFVHDASFRENAIMSFRDVLEQCQTPEALLDWMECIQYGWIDQSGNIRGTGDNDDETEFCREYRLQSADELVKSKVGVCWDQAELERQWFTEQKMMDSEGIKERLIPFFLLYLEIQDDENCPSHTTIVYKQPGNTSEVKWFEHAWYDEKGIHTYSDLKNCLEDIKQKFQASYNDTEHPVLMTLVGLPDKWRECRTCEEYMRLCRNGKKIDLNDVQYDELFHENRSIFQSGDFDAFKCSEDDLMNAMAVPDYVIERSHGKLKHAYRVGVDVKTGEQVAVEFKLNPDSIRQVGAPELFQRSAKTRGKSAAEVEQIQRDALEKVKKNARRKGHIDFVSADREVESIFTKSGKRLDSVTMVPIYSKSFLSAAGIYATVSKKYDAKDNDEIKRMLDAPECQRHMRAALKAAHIQTETYETGKRYPGGKYCSTKLMWGHDLLKFRGTPAVRGYLKIKPGFDAFSPLYDGTNGLKEAVEMFWYNVPEEPHLPELMSPAHLVEAFQKEDWKTVNELICGYETEEQFIEKMILDEFQEESSDEDLMSETAEYDPPMSYDKLPEYLKDDPVHAWRAKTGIELIHREPSRDELQRIWKNWQLMTDSMKSKSDAKSIELFKVNNQDHYNELMKEYDESGLITEEVSKDHPKPKSKQLDAVPDDKKERLVPVYGIVKSYSREKVRKDGTPKSKGELSSVTFANFVSTVTRGDNYSHSLLSFDDTLEHMYSYENGTGFVNDNIMTVESWASTQSIYICVMFVRESDKKRMMKFVKDLEKHRDQSRYAMANLINAYLGKPYKSDKRFICSSFVAYVMAMSDPKNLHRDYSRIRPEDITILPRAFYVMNVQDRDDFKKKRKEIRQKVTQIFRTHREEIEEYNNQLPRILIQEGCQKRRRIDKILEWLMNKAMG